MTGSKSCDAEHVVMLSMRLLEQIGAFSHCCWTLPTFLFLHDDAACCVAPRYQKEMVTYNAKKAAEPPEEEGSDEESE